MTGFGRAEGSNIVVEVRSLNSKQLDLGVRLPSAFRAVEHEIRTRVAKAVERGKVDVTITLSNDNAPSAAINEPLFAAYRQQLEALVGAPLGEGMLSAVLRLPEVVSTGRDEVSEAQQQALLLALDEALTRLDEFRAQEGRRLMDDLLARVETIRTLLKSVDPYEQPRVEAYRKRIRESIEALNIPVDSNRLEQEMIFYVEKLDVTEEKVRLGNHCDYFRQVADTQESAGRKLGFIAQEMGREINTLGSKANDAAIQRIVVEMKDELEKVKEQVLNIL